MEKPKHPPQLELTLFERALLAKYAQPPRRPWWSRLFRWLIRKVL